MTAQEIRARFPDLETVTAMFADSNGIMRGKVLPASGLDKLMKDGVFPVSYTHLTLPTSQLV